MELFKLLETHYDDNIDDVIVFLKQSKELNGFGLAAIADNLEHDPLYRENLEVKGAIFCFDEMQKMAQTILSEEKIDKSQRRTLKRLSVSLSVVLNLWDKNQLHNVELNERLHNAAVDTMTDKWFESGCNKTTQSDEFFTFLHSRLDEFVKQCVDQGLFHNDLIAHFDTLKQQVCDKLTEICQEQKPDQKEIVGQIDARKLQYAVNLTKGKTESLTSLVLPALKVQVIARLKNNSLMAYEELTSRLKSIADNAENERGIVMYKEDLYRDAVQEIFGLWQQGVFSNTPLERQFESVISDVVQGLTFDSNNDIVSVMSQGGLNVLLQDYKDGKINCAQSTRLLKEIADSVILSHMEDLVRSQSIGYDVVKKEVSSLVMAIRTGEVSLSNKSVYSLVNSQERLLCKNIVQAVDSHEKMAHFADKLEDALTRIEQLEKIVASLNESSGIKVAQDADLSKNSSGKAGFFK